MYNLTATPEKNVSTKKDKLPMPIKILMIFSTQKAVDKAKILCTDQNIPGYCINFWEICLKQIYSSKHIFGRT